MNYDLLLLVVITVGVIVTGVAVVVLRLARKARSSFDKNMPNMHMTKAQEKMEFESQSELRSNLFPRTVRTAGAGLT